MKSRRARGLLITAIVLVLATTGVFAQGPQNETAKSKATCVIFSAVEAAKWVATYSWDGNSHRHYLTYLGGDYPEGMSFRSSIKDKEVSKIRAAGGRVIVLDPQYTRDDLAKAKLSCEFPPDNKLAVR